MHKYHKAEQYLVQKQYTHFYIKNTLSGRPSIRTFL